MSARHVSHIAWSKIEPQRHRHTLAESGVDAPDLDAMGLPSQARMPAAGYAIQPDLERALGARIQAPGGRVRVAAGGSEANAMVFAGLLERGDEVLVESPAYEPLRLTPPYFALTVRRFARLGAGTLGSRIEAALTPATRMVVVTHIHNPTGAPLAPAEAKDLNALAERRNLWIFCDECFRDATDEPLGTYAATGPRWVTTSSLTKIYGLGGLRIGWVAGSDEALTRCAETQDALSVQPALPSLALALELTPHLDTLRARTHRRLAANHARWRERMGRELPFTIANPPRGTTVWIEFPREGDGDAFAAHASERHGLALTPGRFFGDSRGVRVGLASEPARFAEAFDTFERAIASFVAREPIRENA